MESDEAMDIERKRKLEEKELADLEAKLKELLAVPGNV